MTVKQLIRLLKGIPPDALVVFGGECLTVKQQDNPAFKKPLKQVVLDTDVIPVLYVSHAQVEDDMHVAVLSFEDPQSTEEPIQTKGYWTV